MHCRAGPAQKGEKPRAPDDLETTNSRYQDGELDSSPTPVSRISNPLAAFPPPPPPTSAKPKEENLLKNTAAIDVPTPINKDDKPNPDADNDDGLDFLDVAARANIRTHTTLFPLERANEALAQLRDGKLVGAAVLRP